VEHPLSAANRISTMEASSRKFGRLLKAKLSISVAAWVFLSIVAIEVIIFIPSYARREQELLTQMKEVSTVKVEAILSLKVGDRTHSQILTQIKSLTNRSNIVGGALYDKDGELIGNFGEVPPLPLQDFMVQDKNKPTNQQKNQQGNQKPVGIVPLPDRNRVDFIWTSLRMDDRFMLILRQDTSSITTELQSFALRIGGLVLIIALFVTATTMGVLAKLVIWPVLRLRDDLEIVGESLNGEVDQANFYSLSVKRDDELGEVMTAFRQMFQLVRSEITSRTESEQALREEQNKSEQLLLNILPRSIADQLKESDQSIADGFSNVTVLFADIVGFTEISSTASPVELVELLNHIFSVFDQLSQQYGLEKIKTIGDAYMVVGGLPQPQAKHAQSIADMALAMQAHAEKFTFRGQAIALRIGINTGSVIAGVIGRKKFSYDLWGDTVNVASRMESSGMPGKIQVTETTYQLLKDQYQFVDRGLVPIKGKGELMTYWLVGLG
jgi:adenylate cyclase